MISISLAMPPLGSVSQYVVSSFMRTNALLKTSRPGFAHGLKLGYKNVCADRLSVGKDSLSYSYKLSPDVPKFTTGLLTALMDELSANGCFAIGLPAYPGLSLIMKTELLKNDLSPYDELDIVTTIAKLGRSTCHTRTDYVCSSTQELVAYSYHVKYMKSGSWFLDQLFNRFLVWDFVSRVYYGNQEPKTYEQKPLFDEILRPHFEFVEPGRAKFTIGKEHFNQGGFMHGGCHAMIIEEVAQSYAEHELESTSVLLESMQVEYLVPARGVVELVCKTIDKDTNRAGDETLHVRVLIQSGDTELSMGTLRFKALNSPEEVLQ